MKIKDPTKRLEQIKARLAALQKEWEALKLEEAKIEEELKLASGNYVKIVCPICDGRAFIQEQDRKKICPYCEGRRYILGKLWQQ